MTRTEKLPADLIALPSVNPAFASSDGALARQPRFASSKFGEKNIADFLLAVAARAGLEVEFQSILPGCSNVIARLLPRGKIKQTILLAPHLDTVNAEEAQFLPGRSNGRLHGRCHGYGAVRTGISVKGS